MHGLRGGVMPLKSGENGQMPPSKKKKKKISILLSFSTN